MVLFLLNSLYNDIKWFIEVYFNNIDIFKINVFLLVFVDRGVFGLNEIYGIW